jgi:hypothetical protein
LLLAGKNYGELHAHPYFQLNLAARASSNETVICVEIVDFNPPPTVQVLGQQLTVDLDREVSVSSSLCIRSLCFLNRCGTITIYAVTYNAFESDGNC